MIANSGDNIPGSIEKVLSSPDSLKWEAAIKKELQSLRSKGTWRVEDLPDGTKALDSKIIFDLKLNANGNVDKYKAGLVVKLYQERTVSDSYAPVIGFSATRLSLACLQKRAFVHHSDVKTAYLNGKFDDNEVVFMNPQKGIEL